jgi:uncharacterized membrane protein
MHAIIDNPRAALGVGLALAGLLFGVALITGEIDALGLIAVLMRLLHVLAAMIWVGLIVFVNFVQLVALRQADAAAREVLHAAIVPGVAAWLRHASTVTVLSGLVLLALAGYLMPTLIYGSSVFVAPAKAILMWTAVVGALVMWMFVHMYIWPNIEVVLGRRAGNAQAKTEARQRVLLFARLNLMLALPVALGMIAAAHLY